MTDGAEPGPADDLPATYDRYRQTRSEPRFTDWLRERAEPAWSNATAHRFTRDLGRGDLSDDVFRRYLVQDYRFLETLVGVFGHAVGEAPSMDAKSRLVSFLATLTDDENDYFERSFDALDVPDEAVEEPEPTATTLAFEDLLERAARQGGYAETLAVLVPAEWIYLEWATAVADRSPERFYLAEWIDLHAVPQFESFVTWLRAELDREGEAVRPGRRERLDRLFRRTVDLEMAFFDAPYEMAASTAVGTNHE